MTGEQRVAFANTLRGFAAISVVIAHYFGRFWLSRETVASLTNSPPFSTSEVEVPIYVHWLHQIDNFNFGAFGVALFFLISGFVVPFSLRKTTQSGFLINRILRIYPTYVVGFSVTLLSILLSGKYFGMKTLFSVREILVHYVPGLRDLLWYKTIDSIIWTLETELKFYLLCALLAPLIRVGSDRIFWVPLVLALISAILNKFLPDLLGIHLALYRLAWVCIFSTNFLVFMFIGTIFHGAYIGRIRPERITLYVSALFGIFLVLWKTGPYSASVDTAWSYGIALLVFILAYSFPTLFAGNRLFDFLADISYPLYVVHGVAGYVALRVLTGLGVRASISLAVVTSSALFLAWLIHKLVEAPTHRIAKRFSSAHPFRTCDLPAGGPRWNPAGGVSQGAA